MTVPWVGPGEPPSNYHNVTDEFRMINNWGFWNFMILPMILCLFLSMKQICGNDDCAESLSAVMCMLLMLSYISHLLAMTIYRWRHSGRVCSGDYNGELQFYLPFSGTLEPYLHLNGSWFFYSLASQIYVCMIVVSGSSFVNGYNR